MSNTIKYGNAIQLGSFASPPTPVENGTIYYNTTFNRFFKYENNAWTGDVSDTDLLNYYTQTQIDAFLALKANQSSLNTEIGNRVAADALLIPLSQKAAANGVATLGSDSKIPLNQIPDAIVGAMKYKGTYDVASAGGAYPASPSQGDYYVASSAGTLTFSSVSHTYAIGDWLAYDGVKWDYIDNSIKVSSVNGQVGTVVLNTDNVSEGSTNQYFTTTRARTAAVVNVTTGAQTDQAASVASMKTYVNGQGFMKFLVNDTAPVLGGDLDFSTFKFKSTSNSLTIQTTQNTIVRSDGTAMIQDRYIKGIALLASQSTAIAIASLTVSSAVIDGMVLQYRVKDSALNVRIGTMSVVTNGTNITFTDLFTDTANTGIVFSGVLSGANINIMYTSGANSATLSADIKQFLV